ncbi:MAG: ATP-binding protein [Euryarchaeota archaeon]|nr:ATP-binding protein [Euryarchaeota archaeon]
MGVVHTGKIRILIVEDEAIVAEDLELAVTNIGYEVVGRAVSADAAVDKALKLNPDLVLMDIVLRGEKNGIDASHEIKEKIDIPVIFLTAYSDVGLIDRAKSTEPYAYLVKPFQERQLHASIETALHKSGIEKRLVESEEWLATTLMSIGDAVIATDGTGCVKSMNHVAERLTGWKQEDAAGKPLTDIFKIMNGGTGEEIENPVTTILREGVVVELADQTMLIAKDGAKIPIDDSFSPIKNDKGGIIGTVLAFHDITERKHAEEERERLVKELEAKNSELERFTYTVSHDLRSPLTTIQGFANVLRMDLEKGKTERVEKNLKYIENGIIKMARLLNDTLELSRIGRVANPSEDVPFGELVSEAMEQTSEQVKSGGVEISVSGELPAVHVDRMKLVEVLVNLIENSIHYMGAEPRPKIDIGCRIDNNEDETIFFVRDNGIGIDQEAHENVFELFYKLDRSTKGTGAGLAIAKRIIEVHEGRIWIESEKGKGCTVCFTLPIAPDR